MQAVIYTRVSLDRNNSGRSVEDQERECRAECEKRQWPVRRVFCDNGISASRYGKARPEWEKCKDALRPDDVLVLWEASRSTRDLEEFVNLRNICAELGVLLSYSGRVLDMSDGYDRFMAGFDALRSEHESEQFKERVLRGKRAGALSGRPAGRVKWGYRVVSPGVWEPDPIEAPKVQESVARILRGDSVNSVVKWLSTQDGYHPPTITVLSRALRSPTYAALRVYRGEVVGSADWPALITEEQHRQLVARTRPRTTPPASPEPRHLLSGIAKCGKPECGIGVRWRRNVHGTPIYSCPRGHVSRLAEPLDLRVKELLFDGLSRFDPRQYDDNDAEIAALWAEIDDCDAKLEQFQELALKGDVSPESFAKFEKALTTQRAELLAQTVPADFMPPDTKSIAANWDSDDDVRVKRHIIRTFFTITIHPATRGHKIGEGGVHICSPQLSVDHHTSGLPALRSVKKIPSRP